MITDSLEHLAPELAELLLNFRHGIEKEGLRVLASGEASLRPHAKELGHKLTHPYITTDYAENLLEFVTPVFDGHEDLFAFVRDVQAFSLEKMAADEMIWPASMPCLLPEEEKIPIADFGASHTGRLKSLYRMGLGYRYGRSMQSIAGMHYNFSLNKKVLEELHPRLAPQLSLREFTDEIYFKLIRNFRRHSWLLSYLFGASPVVDQNFLRGKQHSLVRLGKDTYGKEFSTSLRMGGLGYTSKAQDDISICYNRLKTYVSTLESARKRSYPAYEKIGVKVDGEYRQLNTNLLQIDNEFYSSLRPKRAARSGESALQALHRDGVEYVEVRLLDLDPFSSEGIASESAKFIQLFLTYCLLSESPYIDSRECDQIDANFEVVVNDGRNPKALLRVGEREASAAQQAQALLEEMGKLAQSSPELNARFAGCLREQWEKTENSSKLFSEKLINGIGAQKSFVELARELGQGHKKTLLEESLSQARREEFEALVQTSLKEEREWAKNDSNKSFDQFLDQYFQQISIQEYP